MSCMFDWIRNLFGMASSNEQKNVSQSQSFPPIYLDTTLHELLQQDSDKTGPESLCNVKPNCERQYKSIPHNSKYLITSSQAADGNDLAHMQLENVNYLLSFWAGAMDVCAIAAEGWSDDPSLGAKNIESNATQSFQVINERQRPRVRTFANKQDFIKSYGTEKKKVRWGFAVDFAEDVPSFIHPELMYKLNAKRWLAECDLRSANDQILDCECSCSTHKTGQGLWFYDEECSACKSAIKDEIKRVQGILENREPPFVVKLTQSLGAVGTSLVKNKEERAEVVKHITSYLNESLPYLTAENAHIRPTALVVSDFLPGNTMALNFYIRPDGSPLPLGACHQLSTRGEGGRQMTALTWADQDELNKKYRKTLEHIGQVLKSEGYYGPAGADVMETEDGTQYVIDLNVRTATSLILGLLRGHCEKRGFNAGLVFECLLLAISRERLEKEFYREFMEGRLILLGTARFGKKEKWAYPMVLTGEDQETVKALSERILKFEAAGGKEAKEAGGA